MNTDARSDLERRFDAGPLGEPELIKLVRVLKKERDCWRDNALFLEKERLKLTTTYDHHDPEAAAKP